MGDLILPFAVLAGFIFTLDVLGHLRTKPLSLLNASIWSALYVAYALLFAWTVYYTHGAQAASMFLSGYVMEKALSLDNLMVFVAIFAYFKIPDAYQHRVLHYGIIGAVVFRLIFVTVGAGGLALFGAPVALVFGLVVLWSAFKMWTTLPGDDEPVDYAAQWYARWAAAVLRFTNEMPGPVFFTKVCRFCLSTDTPMKDCPTFSGGYGAAVLAGTPLLMCLIAIEISDVLFSFDSVPAVIAVTQDPVLVYSAMIFAILGLRMMYFVLTALMRYLTRLGGAVVAVLGFIGVKLVASSIGQLAPHLGFATPGSFEISPAVSLAVVLGLLALGVGASILWPETPTNSSNEPVVR